MSRSEPNLRKQLLATTKFNNLSLELGASYVVDLVQINNAGGTTTFASETIVTDWTPPKCNSPFLSAGPGQAMVQANSQPPGSTAYGGTRVHAWVNANTTQVTVHLGGRACEDPESGIVKSRLWVGSKRNGKGDILARREVSFPSVVTIDAKPFLDLELS